MQLINKYFHNLSKKQEEQFASMAGVYHYWNSRINVISRRDIDQLYLHHILHSLSIAKVISFKPGTTVLDAGTGGGFPGIPLSVMFPETHFLLVDSTAKKMKVVSDVIKETGLTNCMAQWSRIEKVNMKFDFVVSRAVTDIPRLIDWISDKILDRHFNSLHNGMFYLKGGHFEKELEGIDYKFKIFNINRFFSEDFYKTKKIVYIDLTSNS